MEFIYSIKEAYKRVLDFTEKLGVLNFGGSNYISGVEF